MTKTLSLPVEIISTAQEKAVASHMSLSGWIAQAIQEKIEKEGKKKGK